MSLVPYISANPDNPQQRFSLVHLKARHSLELEPTLHGLKIFNPHEEGWFEHVVSGGNVTYWHEIPWNGRKKLTMEEAAELLESWLLPDIDAAERAAG